MSEDCARRSRSPEWAVIIAGIRSFSNLFVAAARYADVPANFQLVDSPPQWDINNKTWVLAQHINVSGIVRREMTPEEKRAFRTQQPMTGT